MGEETRFAFACGEYAVVVRAPVFDYYSFDLGRVAEDVFRAV